VAWVRSLREAGRRISLSARGHEHEPLVGCTRRESRSENGKARPRNAAAQAEVGAGEGNRTLVFSLEVKRFREVLQRFFRQIAAKHPHRFQKTILRCRNVFEAVAAEVARFRVIFQ
jgi:hypothetical protein